MPLWDKVPTYLSYNGQLFGLSVPQLYMGALLNQPHRTWGQGDLQKEADARAILCAVMKITVSYVFWHNPQNNKI